MDIDLAFLSMWWQRGLSISFTLRSVLISVASSNCPALPEQIYNTRSKEILIIEDFLDFMRSNYAVFILLPALMTSSQCQQTADYWINELLDLHDQGKYDEAIKAYIGVINDSVGIIRLSPGDLSKWVIQGDYVRRHNAIKAYRDAIMVYDEAIRLDPNDVVAWYNKGIALETLTEYDSAIECFDEAIRLNPNNAGPWTGKGVALYLQIIVFNITYLTYHTETWESTFELKKDLPSYQRSYL